MSDPSEEREQRIYNIILRMVLWDEKDEDVFKKLEVSGFSEQKAQEMYARARAERMAAIRGDSWRKAGFGLMWFALGAGVFGGFWYGLGGITRLLLILTGAAMAFGGWRFTEGFVGLVTASSKRGSLAHED